MNLSISGSSRLLNIYDFAKMTPAVVCGALHRQLHEQHKELNRLRFKRPEVIAAFQTACSSRKFSEFGSVERLSAIDKSWVLATHKDLKKAYDNLVADATKWGGQLGNNLNKPLTDLCQHCMHSLLCLDLIIAMDSENCPFSKSFKISKMISEMVLPDIEALTKEKFGICPEVTIREYFPKQECIQPGGVILPYAAPQYLEFVFVELLKNSFESVIQKYGALNIEEEEAIGFEKNMALTLIDLFIFKIIHLCR
jgi:hypothetical protein